VRRIAVTVSHRDVAEIALSLS